MIRQKPESYEPEKDSPLIGGHGKDRSFIVIFDGRDFPQAEGDGGGAHCMRTCDIITLLEQAGEEFPESTTEGGWGCGEEHQVYDADDIDAWKKKWLTVPPLCG